MTSPDTGSTLFSEPARTSRTLANLHELFITSGSHHSMEDFTRALTKALEHSPDPDAAVTNLLRFAEAATSKESLFNDLVDHQMLIDVLVKMFSYSQYFSDILVRTPELFRWLTASDALVNPRSKSQLKEEVERAMGVFKKPDRTLDSLKRLYRREVLRIGARDILGEADLQTLTGELSHLADVLVDASCRIAHQQLADRYPATPQTPYAVIGLGKLGGSELNYSSDIDIIFVYGDEGELVDVRGKTRTYHEYFNAFVEKLVVNLTQSSPEGHLYRVDTRLRPESGAGPLARSVQSYLLYYESRGELWERQMLIKSRAIAGNTEFGEGFIAQLEPFIYPRTFFQNPRESIARIKARIEAAIAGEDNVKLRAGGIRDIEFIVQALQLLNGGKNRNIRQRNTMDAINRLSEAKLLTADERCLLGEAYTFFRTVEHRLQTFLNTQTHELPGEEKERTLLARKVGLRSAEEFLKKSDAYVKGVRNIFESVLMSGPAGPIADIRGIIDGNPGSGMAAGVLAQYGFKDTRKASKNLAVLVSGSSLTGAREMDGRARDAFRDIAGVLFEAVSHTPDPDMTLHTLAHVSSAHKFPEQLYRQLREENFRRLLLGVCASSPRLAKSLARQPLLLETLATDPLSLGGKGMAPPAAGESLVEVKNREELRAGIRYVLGLSDFDGLAGELSRIADVIVNFAMGEAFKTSPGRKTPLVLFALGKYGTGEINYDSDLDVVFVADAKSAARRNALEKMATAIVNSLNVVSQEGKLYDIDTRLRPEGKSAPLVVDRKAYLAYLKHRASLWERQSLTRLRFVAGDENLGRAIAADVAAFVYDSPLPPAWVDGITAMRKKTETRSRVSGAEYIDIKLGQGGMVDIEFLAQMLQMKYGGPLPAMRSVKTCDVFGHVPASGGRAQWDELTAAYGLYREIETLMRLTLEERGTILPAGERLDLLARQFNGSTGESLAQLLSSTMKNVRRIFMQLTTSLKNNEPS